MSNFKRIVFVVDDEESNCDLLSSILQDDYQVKTFSSGEACLNQLTTIAPDIILLDINMPEMDGFEVCRCLKEDRATFEIPVIFITAYTAPEDRERGFEVGATEYITKPINSTEVKDIISMTLANQCS